MAKKVLILPSWYPNTLNAHGSFFREQAALLNRNGYDVKVLMVQELHTKNFYFQRLKSRQKGVRFALSHDFLLQEPDAYSYPVIIQKSWSTERKLQAIDKAYLKAFKILISSQNWFPEIIHLQGMYQLGLSSYLIAETYQLPLVVIEHSPFKINNYRPEYQERIRNIFKTAKKVAGVSYFHKTCLSKVDATSAVEVVWNFMDEARFTYVPSLKLEDKFIITTILRVSAVKDPVTFFDAVSKFVQVCKGNRSIEVHVVGLSCIEDLTSLREVDEHFVAKYNGISKLLRFHPWLDREDIRALHQRSSVFVSTSIDEPYGVAVREAMLCGTPVVSTKSGGPEDTIGKENGLLVPIGDSGGVALALQALYDHTVAFKGEDLRVSVITQSGHRAFLARMEAFYKN
ncbi:glycosyltransferase [Mangrovimonas xylaniphaga]|uniref:glycosyltransferase n=1 Tax=Mangrovimonas xylaniphaga TaxID=1645915 RepID=UPI0006B69421|nr:glycosyltransferase [Mangrovimonas xylaniphaga]